MYRLIASDMDETFLGHDHRVPEANIEALARLRELGALFVPASGRAYASVMESLSPVRELLEGSYVLSYNGGCINRVGDPEPLESRTLPFEKARELFAYGMGEDVAIHVYELSGRVWGFRLQSEERAYLAGHMPIEESDSTDIDFLRDVPVCKVLFVRVDGLGVLREVERRMRQVPGLLDGVTTTYSSNRYLELCPAGVDKGAGLLALARHLGVDPAETIGMGDSANDLGMIRAAGLGVAVSNATEEALDAADYRAASSCDDGVLGEILEKFFPAG